MIPLIYFLSGLIFGSFINVIIYRVPLNLSIINPRSFCPHCKAMIPFYRNIPLISYFIQLGKCNNCNNKISPIYPAIELLIAIIFIFSQYNFDYPESIVYILISSILLTIAIIDYRYYIIPIQLSIGALIILLPYIIFKSNTIYHVYGMLIGLSYLLFIFVITWIITKKQPIGLGDIQLIIILGLWGGPLKILMTIFLAACFGITYWIILTMINGYTKNRKLPFGTFLSLSSIIIYSIELNWDIIY